MQYKFYNNLKNVINMIQVKRLDNKKQIFDVKTGQIYLAKKSRDSNQFYLNNKIKLQNIKGNPTSNVFPVKVLKISPPFSVDVEYIEGQYEIETETINLNEINKSHIGKKFTLEVTIDSIITTSGPTIFMLNDGTAILKATAFEKGKRAYPDLNDNDVIKATINVTEYDGSLECQLDAYKVLEDEASKNLLQKINQKLLDKAKPTQTNFLVNSDILEKLKPKIIEVATIIRQAIFENRPVVVRHHADCDGYCGGIALERAITPLILEQHNNEKAVYQYYRRAPSKAPFYEFIDVVKDLTFAIEDKAKFGQKEPLIILIDNGSTQEDVLAIRKMKLYDSKIVVIDHHFPGEVINGQVEVDKYVDAHVNPYLVGGDSSLVAGMLGVEVARFINNQTKDIEYLGAIAGVGDRSDGPEMQQYLEFAKKHGYEPEYLKKLAEVIDFEAFYLKFMESRGLVSDILGFDKNKQEKLVTLLYEVIEEKRANQLKIIQKYNKVIKLDKFQVVILEMEKLTSRGEYPAVGKSTGIGHDYFKQNSETVTLGFGPDFLTIRSSDHTGFNVNNLVKYLQKEMPYANIDGGGHERAGSVKFVEASKVEVREKTLEFIKEL